MADFFPERNRDSRLQGNDFSLRGEPRTMDQWVPIIVIMLNMCSQIYWFKKIKSSMCQPPMRRALLLIKVKKFVQSYELLLSDALKIWTRVWLWPCSPHYFMKQSESDFSKLPHQLESSLYSAVRISWVSSVTSFCLVYSAICAASCLVDMATSQWLSKGQLSTSS